MILSAAAGAIVGAIFGFVASSLVLLMRQSRNDVLVGRGAAPIRDAVRPGFVLPSLILGAAIAAISTRWLSLSVAMALATILPVVSFLVSAAVIASQLKKTRAQPPAKGANK